MVFIYSTILRYLAQIIKGNKRLCYKEVISYSITITTTGLAGGLL